MLDILQPGSVWLFPHDWLHGKHFWPGHYRDGALCYPRHHTWRLRTHVVSPWEMQSLTLFFAKNQRDQSCLPEAFKYFLVVGIVWSGHRLGFLLLSILCGLWPAALSFLPGSQVIFALLFLLKMQTPFLWSPLSSTCVFRIYWCHHHLHPTLVHTLLLEIPSPRPAYKYLFVIPNTSESYPLSAKTSFFKVFSSYFEEKNSQLHANTCTILLTLANSAFSKRL